MKKFVLPVGSLILALIFSMSLDQPVSLWFDEPARDNWRRWAFEITDIGKAEQWFALSLLTYVICRVVLKYRPSQALENIKNWASHFFWALSCSGIILLALKFVFGRQRPHISQTRDALVFHPFNSNWDFQSFPSGHTQTLFCVASFAVLLWPSKSRWFWLLAALLAFTRTMSLQHFPSDLIGGALIGLYGTRLSLHLVSKKIPLPHKLES